MEPLLQLGQIEEQLRQSFAADKKSWISTYLLMRQVETEKLWKPDYKDFTQWVNHLAEICGVKVGLIWNRRSAGEVYARYESRAHERGKNVPALDTIEVSPDSLQLIKKISQGNADVEDNLVDKLMQGDLSRRDLRSAWRDVRSTKEARGEKAVQKNHHDHLKAKSEDGKDGEERLKVEAADIVRVLQNRDWLSALLNEDLRTDWTGKKYIYRTFAEFAVRTGMTRNARRIDVVVAETLTATRPDEITLHGIEIKVAKSDLENDHKMLEYRDFVDYLYFGVPDFLYDAASDVAADGVGIIVYRTDGESNGKLEIRRMAERKDTPMGKIEALSTALIKVL